MSDCRTSDGDDYQVTITKLTRIYMGLRYEKLTFEDHERFGLALHKMRREVLHWHCGVFPKTSRHDRELGKILKGIENLQNIMDSLVFREFPEKEPGDLMDVYYPDQKIRSQKEKAKHK